MITDKYLIDAINNRLKDEYRVLDGRPVYRIVWSDDQLEKRKGNYSEFYGSIFIREQKNVVKEVKKYWYFEKPCWVFEKLVFMPREQQMYELITELVESRNGTYESAYAFWSTRRKIHLPVDLEVCEAIIFKLQNPTKPLTQKDFDALEKLEEEQEVDAYYAQLSANERSPLFVKENSAWVSTNQLAYKRSLKLGQEYVEKSSAITLE